MKKQSITKRILSAHELAATIAYDTDRPHYHFCVPFDLGFPADPNAAFYACGRYHMFFVYESREDSYRWGHAVSADLVHWSFLPDALVPDETDGGIYSGGVFLEEDGTAVVAYWSLGKEGGNGGIRIAVAHPPLYETWTKYPGYAVKCSEHGIAVSDEGAELACADPSNLWKKDGKYYFACGNLLLLNRYRGVPDAPRSMTGDYADVYVSDDLNTWKYLHRLYKRDETNTFTDPSEDCMCPYLGVVPDGEGKDTDTHILLFLAHNRGTQYYLGTFDEKRMEFLPTRHGRMSFVDNALFAPEAVRTADGRLVVFNWLRDNRDDDLQRELGKGWSGIHALPREILLGDDGTLRIRPLTELAKLRVGAETVTATARRNTALSPVMPRHCELQITQRSDGKGRIGVRIFYGPRSYTDVYADLGAGELVIDTMHSGTRGRRVTDRAPLAVGRGQTVELRVFSDGCVLEVFANSVQAMTRQMFPCSSRDVRIVCRNQTSEAAAVTVYDMVACNGLM